MPAQQSLQRKLVVLVAAAIGTATLVSTAIAMWQQSTSYAATRRQSLVTTAQVFAAAAAKATAYVNQDGAFEALRGMAQVPDVRYAEVRTSAGRTLAGFGAVARLIDDVSLAGDESVSLAEMLTSGTIKVTVPIVESGVEVGQFALIGGISDLRPQLISTAIFTSAGGGLAMLIGLLVAWRFQRRITEPLRLLLRAMTRVREEKRYDITAQQANDREIGELVGGFNRMLAEIRERDTRLEVHARNLEEEVRAQTIDLRIARDAAEDANRAKSDFLATMSHEIRTPMNGIMVMAELLVQANLPPRQQRFADVIARSGKSLLAIINDILDLSKIEAGKLELERLPVDINSLAENTTSLFAERAREKGLDLAAFVDPNVPSLITSDPVRLGQVISNLVNNALKFTERGSVALSAELTPDGGCVAIAVTDTGIGIAADKLGTIFESFSQADHSTTRNFGGTGLGLTISQRLAHALGGQIKVESEPGKGSIFSVTLPLDAQAGPCPWPTLDPKENGSAVCVIDIDGEASKVALARYFAASGYTIAEAPLSSGAKLSASVICAEASRLKNYPLSLDRKAPLRIAICVQGDRALDEFIASGQADASLTKPVLRSEVEDVLKRICSDEQIVQPRVATRTAAPTTALKAFRALVADDNAVNREVAFAALSQLNATIVSVENGLEAVAAVAVDKFDIVFMDGSMPVMDGFEAARRIRASGGESGRIPIVALTAHVIGAAVEEWRTAGMDEVIFKPFTITKLSQTIQRLLPHLAVDAKGAAEPENVADAQQHGVAAVLDPVVLAQLRKLQESGQIGFVKKVLGLYVEHAPAAVDQILSAARSHDVDESARAAHALKSMSYNVGALSMSALAQQIESDAKKLKMVPSEKILLDLTRALAVTLEAIFQEEEFDGARPHLAKPAIAEAARPLENALAHAAERNELSVRYQPIVDRTGTTTTGIEALLRWEHEGSSVSPAVFIPLAEKSGSIHDIGMWVLRRACLDACDWNPGIELSVNVSAVQFSAPDLAQRITRVVEETGFDWKRLQLEITETALLTEEEAVLGVMTQLRERGISFALDDFGTGYSSLTYLRRFPFDKIKIDRSFIADISLAVNATIVHAVTSIGRSLGLKVVAEGVESTDQHRFLTAAGVHFLQGYLFGKPISFEEISERLNLERKMLRSA